MPKTDEDLPFLQLVGNVRSMRRLKPDPVPMDVIRRVLNAGVQASSGQNLQPWSFVLVGEAEPKRWFAERYAAAMQSRFRMPAKAERSSKAGRMLASIDYQIEHLHEAPYLLLVCGKRDWPFKVPPSERVGLAPPNYGAVYPCVQNMLLACRALGLGAALTTMHQVFEQELHAYFAIPEAYGVVVTMPIGYPMGKFGPVKRRPAEDVTYLNKWGNGLRQTLGNA